MAQLGPEVGSRRTVARTPHEYIVEIYNGWHWVAEVPSSAVTHPEHYSRVPGIECIDVAQHFNYNSGAAIKYIWRAGLKDKSKHIEDLQKAINYLEFEIERVKKSQT